MTTETTVKCPECGEQVGEDLRLALLAIRYPPMFNGGAKLVEKFSERLAYWDEVIQPYSQGVIAMIDAVEWLFGGVHINDLTRAVRHRMDEEAR